MRLRILLAVLAALTLAGAGIGTRATAGSTSATDIDLSGLIKGPSGLPVPRFVALKKNEVLARFGPSFDYPVAYEFHRQGLPLKVIAEDRDNIWRRVEDRDGRRMWIHRSMLSNNSNAVVDNKEVVLRTAPRADAPGRVKLSAGVMARIETCEDGWCRLKTGDFRGWLPEDTLWGVN